MGYTIKREIEFSWMCDDDISLRNKIELDEYANRHIFEMAELGYSSGQMEAVVDGDEYSGLWQITCGYELQDD